MFKDKNNFSFLKSLKYKTIDNNLHQSPSAVEQDWQSMNMNDQKTSMNGNYHNNKNNNSQSPPSPTNQDWLNNVGNLPNGVIPYDDSPQSPTNATDRLLSMNMANLTKNSVLNNNQIMLNNLNNEQNHFSQHRSHSPNDGFNSLIVNHHNGIPSVNSRSHTPGIGMGSTHNGCQDEYMPFKNISMTQNLNQLSKLIAPIDIPSAPLLIKSISPTMSNDQAFSGNGNLNPPVRTGKISCMTIKTKFGQLGQGKGQFQSPHGFCLGVDE